MKFILASAAYLVIGLILAAGIFLAVKGSFWLLAVGGLAYLLLFSKFGCLTH